MLTRARIRCSGSMSNRRRSIVRVRWNRSPWVIDDRRLARIFTRNGSGDALNCWPFVVAIRAAPLERPFSIAFPCDECHPPVRVAVWALQGHVNGNVESEAGIHRERSPTNLLSAFGFDSVAVALSSGEW